MPTLPLQSLAAELIKMAIKSLAAMGTIGMFAIKTFGKGFAVL